MIAVGKRLMDEAPSGCDVTWRAADITREPEPLCGGPFDLCLISYALNELPHAERLPLVERLWKVTSGALALVAPGTPAGFAAIREARGWLLEAGAHLVAPCPHGDACPMAPGDWCHFSQRLARSRLHRQLKGGEAPYEDEKFAYVVAARMPARPFAARVIRHPVVRSGHISLHLCTPEGLMQAEVTRSDKASWRSARETHWGSSLAALPEKRHPL
jgi:ribosomal protein RSM22 (predicted rRNA methylase)